jgi:hypothetical protein
MTDRLFPSKAGGKKKMKQKVKGEEEGSVALLYWLFDEKKGEKREREKINSLYYLSRG